MESESNKIVFDELLKIWDAAPTDLSFQEKFEHLRAKSLDVFGTFWLTLWSENDLKDSSMKGEMVTVSFQNQNHITNQTHKVLALNW